MTLNVYYPPTEPQEPETPEPVDDRHTIAWGYNLADLDQLARMAVSRVRTAHGSYLDRYEAAWTAISEHLCTAQTGPDRADLLEAGQAAVYHHINDEYRHHGYDLANHSTRVRYAAYWIGAPTTSMEDAIVDRLALYQVLPTLTRKQLQAVNAFAATGDPAQAAAAMGCRQDVLHSHLYRGRKRFRRYWHEGETPPKKWGVDRRSAVAPCDQERRITESELEDIRDRYYAGDKQAAIAADYGVHRVTVYNLLTGRTKPAPDPVEAP